MSKPEIIKKLKDKYPNISKKNLERIFDLFFSNIAQSLSSKTSVEIRSIGTFFLKEIKEKKTARNPKTGEIIYVPKKKQDKI